MNYKYCCGILMHAEPKKVITNTAPKIIHGKQNEHRVVRGLWVWGPGPHFKKVNTTPKKVTTEPN